MHKSCYLRLDNNSLFTVNLPHNETVILGRNNVTKIRDSFVSRNQIECTADIINGNVKVLSLGNTPSGINGYVALKNQPYYLGHGDIIEVRLGYYPFEIMFETNSTDDDIKEPSAKKLKEDMEPKILQTDSAEKTGWEEVDDGDLVIYTSKNCFSKSKIAAFDLDGTLIKTKSGAKFPENNNDWVLAYSNIKTIFKKLLEDDFKIVFFTNQLKLNNDKNKLNDFKIKIENIIHSIGVAIQAFIAMDLSIYRKPAPGMWYALKDKNKLPLNVDESFYVGDAAGRKKNWAPGKPKDHSHCDRLFAVNLNLKFYTPEEYFLNARSIPYEKPEFEPCKVSIGKLPDIKRRYEIILMVGCAASGKSTYCINELIPKGYVHISSDKLGSWNKCVKAMKTALDKKQSVVVDNTNLNKETRKKIIDVARQYNIECRCFLMDITFAHCKHNNRFREIIDKKHSKINIITLNSQKKKYQKPELSEGFSEIVPIPFVPKFDSSEHANLYDMYLLAW